MPAEFDGQVNTMRHGLAMDGKTRQMSGKTGVFGLLGGWVLALAVLGARGLEAQTVIPADTTKRPAGYGDSASSVGTDTGTRTGATPAAGPDTSTKRPEAPKAVADTTPPAADPALVSACKPGPDGAPVGVLLLVKFAPRTTDAERGTAAKSIGGQLGGDSPDGLTYIVPPADRPLRDAEDSLIRAHGVREVGEQPCP
jgi:hypothetical protein